MSRLFGVALIIRGITPILIVLMIAGLAIVIVNDLSSALEKPIGAISEEVALVEGAIEDVQEDFTNVQEAVSTLIEDLTSFSIPNPLAGLSSVLTIPAINIPDIPSIPIPTIDIEWDSVNIPLGFTTIRIRYPVDIDLGTTNFSINIPDIPSFNITIPGLDLLKDAIENVIDEVTTIFDVFDPAFEAINELTATLDVLAGSVERIGNATGDALEQTGEALGKWVVIIVIITIIILILVVNYIFAAMVKDVRDGWLLLKGQSLPVAQAEPHASEDG